MGHATTPQFLMSAIWIPWCFSRAHLVRHARAPPDAAPRSALRLSGHHNVPIYLADRWWILARLPFVEAPRRLLIATFVVTAALVSAGDSCHRIRTPQSAGPAPEPQH
jgi:hypothetical protein